EKQGEATLATRGEAKVAPDAVDGDAVQVGAQAAKLGGDLVVERHLVAAHRAPVSGIEGEDDQLPAEVAQREALVRRAVEREVGGLLVRFEGHGPAPCDARRRWVCSSESA